MRRAILTITVMLLAMSSIVWAEFDQKLTLMLGGKLCDAYLGDLESALKKVPGVKAVDFKSIKGHAIVTVKAGKARVDQLAHVVNGVKGDGWHCTAQAM
jgi:hypothetical protein